ncbi:MAG: VOC family protein [Actinobacteria bacterium]|nr:VOC family protein [Actinomycetota bacterium]
MTAANVGALLGRIGTGLFQQAWVMGDLREARTAMRRTLGCGEFVEIRTGDLPYDLRGSRVSCDLSLAFARSGNVQIELVQPLRGEGIHCEFLAQRGPGAHHLGFLVADLDATVSAAASDGFACVMAGDLGPVRISYLDTFDALGVYVELLEDPDGMLMATMPWRDDEAASS